MLSFAAEQAVEKITVRTSKFARKFAAEQAVEKSCRLS